MCDRGSGRKRRPQARNSRQYWTTYGTNGSHPVTSQQTSRRSLTKYWSIDLGSHPLAVSRWQTPNPPGYPRTNHVKTRFGLLRPGRFNIILGNSEIISDQCGKCINLIQPRIFPRTTRCVTREMRACLTLRVTSRSELFSLKSINESVFNYCDLFLDHVSVK